MAPVTGKFERETPMRDGGEEDNQERRYEQ